MAMTHKQRILAAAAKQPVDKLPFGARIDLWYCYHSANGTLPEKYKGWSMIDILRDLGAGFQVILGGTEPCTWATGHRSVVLPVILSMMMCKEELRNMEVVVRKELSFTTTEVRTPVGTVSEKAKLNPLEGSICPYVTEYLFKSEEDYPPIEYLFENTTLIPDYDEYLRLADMVGEDGVIACGLMSPMQYIMREIMSYEMFVYELCDHPRKLEHLYEVLKEQWRRRLDIIANSPAEMPQICGNWIDALHTPIFRKYFVPWLREATELLHARGKLTRVHIDGEMRRLIPFFIETGIDVAEAWSPVPMTLVTTAELRKAWGDKVTIWGGIPTVLFSPMYRDEEFDAYIINLFKEIAPGNNFIVGMGDNFPVDGNINRIRRVVELIDKYAALPIQI